MSRSEWSPIEREVNKNIGAYLSFVDKPFLIAAVSGGVDSMCLLYTLKQLGIPALVAHVNYQKRGEDSHKDARLIDRIAAEWGFESHITKVDPAEAEGENFQQWARQVRYNIFRELSEKYNADAVAVAHHRDDQVETILQKVFRGAGMASLTGMEVWDGQLFRPLLDISREEIEEYAAQNDVPYRTDESNLKSDFARNFLRNEWKEGLSSFFPGWQKNVLRMAEQAGDHEKAISWIAEQMTDEKGINRSQFSTLDAGLQKSVILWMLKQKEPGIEISKGGLAQIEDLDDLQTGQEIEITSHFAIHRDREHYRILSGETDEEFHPRILKKSELAEKKVRVDDIQLNINKHENPDFESVLYLDADKISWPVTVRRWRSGDYIQPLGMEGTQLVSDHLTNRKISSAFKHRSLVIESFEETICAIIFPPIKNQLSPGTISEIYKCDPETVYSLQIKFIEKS